MPDELDEFDEPEDDFAASPPDDPEEPLDSALPDDSAGLAGLAPSPSPDSVEADVFDAPEPDLPRLSVL